MQRPSDPATQLHQYWFDNPRVWFHSTAEDDALIAQRFEALLDLVPDIDSIILYDQVPRHVFRGQAANHIIAFFLEKALKLAEALSDEHAEALSDERWIFSVMPFRHASLRTEELLRVAWRRLENTPRCGSGAEALRGFIRSTYTKSVPALLNTVAYPALAECPECPECDIADYRDVIDPDCFSEGFGLGFSEGSGGVETTVHAPFAACMQLVQPVVVSLSGGVDSMVCLRALSELNVPLIAVHVNFGNRESDADREERFVRAYCRARGVDLVVRRFDEIQRDACMANDFRELYETYTKRERHATYLVAHRLLGIDDAGIASVRVVLGHHIDDVFENVLVNVANATKLKNLDGMTERALVFGDRIELWRPMIRLEKAVVFAYARRFGVPYFMNTTPDWVQRGILRTRVVPAIREWNPDFVPGLLQLSEQMKDAYVAVEAAVLMCGIGCSGSGSTGITAPRTKSELFWRVFLETHFTRALSSKSLRNFTSKVQTLPGPSGEFTVMLNKSTKVCCATTSDDRVVLRRKPI